MLRHPCSISGQGGTAHAPSNVPILGQLVLIIRCLTQLGLILASSGPHLGLMMAPSWVILASSDPVGLATCHFWHI